jgi:FkbM family methyltransferase
MTTKGSSPPGNQEPIDSVVPGHRPVTLHRYYPEFAAYYPQCETATKAFVADHLPTDAITLDVGANVGIYAILCGRVARTGHVHAFEPTATAAMLRTNLKHAGVTNATVHEVAVGDVSGCRDEHIYRVWGQDPDHAAYQFVTIDEFVDREGLTRVDLLKIDVDGFDLEVLRGSRATLARFDPLLIIEINHALATRGRHATEVYETLAEFGYRHARVLDLDNVITRRSFADSPSQPTQKLTLHLDPPASHP